MNKVGRVFNDNLNSQIQNNLKNMDSSQLEDLTTNLLKEPMTTVDISSLGKVLEKILDEMTEALENTILMGKELGQRLEDGQKNYGDLEKNYGEFEKDLVDIFKKTENISGGKSQESLKGMVNSKVDHILKELEDMDLDEGQIFLVKEKLAKAGKGLETTLLKEVKSLIKSLVVIEKFHTLEKRTEGLEKYGLESLTKSDSKVEYTKFLKDEIANLTRILEELEAMPESAGQKSELINRARFLKGEYEKIIDQLEKGEKFTLKLYEKSMEDEKVILENKLFKDYKLSMEKDLKNNLYANFISKREAFFKEIEGNKEIDRIYMEGRKDLGLIALISVSLSQRKIGKKELIIFTFIIFILGLILKSLIFE